MRWYIVLQNLFVYLKYGAQSWKLGWQMDFQSYFYIKEWTLFKDRHHRTNLIKKWFWQIRKNRKNFWPDVRKSVGMVYKWPQTIIHTQIFWRSHFRQNINANKWLKTNYLISSGLQLKFPTEILNLKFHQIMFYFIWV